MPDISYLTLHFFHTLALALWVGGSVAIGAIVAPTAFAELPDRTQAGRVVGRSLRRFDLVVLACIVALVVTSGLMVAWFDRWSAWYAVEYACIGLMSASAIFSMLVLAPRMRRLGSGLDAGASEAREEFERLHGLSVTALQFNLACGTVAILFS